jgi:hypothetical protein
MRVLSKERREKPPRQKGGDDGGFYIHESGQGAKAVDVPAPETNAWPKSRKIGRAVVTPVGLP